MRALHLLRVAPHRFLNPQGRITRANGVVLGAKIGEDSSAAVWSVCPTTRRHMQGETRHVRVSRVQACGAAWTGRADSPWCAFLRTAAAGSFWITPMNGSRNTCTCHAGSSRRIWQRCCVDFTSTLLCTTVSTGWTGFGTRSSYSGSERYVDAASGTGCFGAISRAARGLSCRVRRLCIRRSEGAET